MAKQHDEFQFGKGEPSVATDKAYLPSAILGVPLLWRQMTLFLKNTFKNLVAHMMMTL